MARKKLKFASGGGTRKEKKAMKALGQRIDAMRKETPLAVSNAEESLASKAAAGPKIDAPTKPDYDSMSFKTAFRTARDRGEKTFGWKGKSFTTQMASEVSRPALRRTTAPTARPVARSTGKPAARSTSTDKPAASASRSTPAAPASRSTPAARPLATQTASKYNPFMPGKLPSQVAADERARVTESVSRPTPGPVRTSGMLFTSARNKKGESPWDKDAKGNHRDPSSSGARARLASMFGFNKGGKVKTYKRGGKVVNGPTTGPSTTTPMSPDAAKQRKAFEDELRKRNEEARKGENSQGRFNPDRKAKGGKVMKKSDKAGRALVKKSADTKGRAMKFAKGGSIDGCAKRGKTKGKMLARGGKCH